MTDVAFKREKNLDFFFVVAPSCREYPVWQNCAVVETNDSCRR